MTTINLKLPYWHHQLALGWYQHQPESHQQSFNQRCWRYIERPGPIDRTPETPGSGKIPISRFSSNLFHLLFISTHTSWSVPLHRRCWQGGRIRGTGRSRTSFKCVEETKVRNLSLDGKIFDEEYEPGVKPRCNSLAKPFLCRCHLERWTSIKVSSRKSRRHLLSFDADFLGIRWMNNQCYLLSGNFPIV